MRHRRPTRSRLGHQQSVSAPARAARPRLHHAEEPRADGLDAHRPGGRPQALRSAWPRIFAERARGGVGPDRHRRLRAQHRGLGQAVRRHAGHARRGAAAPASSPTPCTPRAARSRCRSCTPGATATHPLCGGAVAHQVARSSPFTPRELIGARHRAADPRLRPLRRAGARGRLRRRRDDGLARATSSTSSSSRTPTSAPTTGAAPTRTACACRSRSCARTREAVGPRLHHHLPPVDARPGARRQQLGRGGAAGQGACEAAGATHHQHRHRLARGAHADHRHHRCRARAFAWVTRRRLEAARSRIPLITTNRINTPEVAEQILADGCADMVSMARPLLADAEFVEQGRAGPRRRDQHLHRLQPGLPGPHLREQARAAAWSTRAPATRPSWSTGRSTRPQAHRRGRRRARRAWRPRPTLAERGHEVHAVRSGRRDRRPVQHGQAHPGQGRVQRDAALLRTPARASPACTLRLGTRVDAAALIAQRLRRGGARHRRHAARPAHPGPGRIPKVLSYIDVLRHGKPVGKRVAIIGAGGIGFDVAEFLVHAPATRRRWTCTTGWREWGVADPAQARGGVRAAAQPQRRRAPGDAAAAQGRQARRGPGQDHRLDPPRRAEDEAAWR